MLNELHDPRRNLYAPMFIPGSYMKYIIPQRAGFVNSTENFILQNVTFSHLLERNVVGNAQSFAKSINIQH